MQKIDGITVTMATPYEKVVANIRMAESRPLLQIHELPDWREGVPVALVGGGPSLRATLPVLRRYQYIMACGSAHDYLVAQGVVPRWCVVCDPDPVMANYLRLAHADTTYLVASQCDPVVFEELVDRRVALWNCGGSASDNLSLWGNQKTVVISGGCTVLTRSIFMAVNFGFRDIHLFGCDTCVSGDQHHAYPFSTDKESIGDLTPFRIGGPNGREFMMAAYHLGQLFDFKNTLRRLGHRARFTVHGDGAIAEVVRLGQEAARQTRAA